MEDLFGEATQVAFEDDEERSCITSFVSAVQEQEKTKKIDADIRSSNKEEQSTYKEMLDQLMTQSEHTCRPFVYEGQEYFLRKVKSSSSKPINSTALESAFKAQDVDHISKVYARLQADNSKAPTTADVMEEAVMETLKEILTTEKYAIRIMTKPERGTAKNPQPSLDPSEVEIAHHYLKANSEGKKLATAQKERMNSVQEKICTYQQSVVDFLDREQPNTQMQPLSIIDPGSGTKRTCYLKRKVEHITPSLSISKVKKAKLLKSVLEEKISKAVFSIQEFQSCAQNPSFIPEVVTLFNEAADHWKENEAKEKVTATIKKGRRTGTAEVE